MVSKIIKPFHWSFLQVIRLVALCLLIWLSGNYVCRYECGYGPKDHYEDPIHMKSIKHSSLTHFSIKRFYTRPDVVEITFYHWTHIWANGDPTHNACDPRSTSQMSTYDPLVSRKLKEFIWTQLGLRYTVKQIYDKHKEIQWAWVNVGECMTQNDFLWF